MATEAYCVKCRKKKKMVNEKEVAVKSRGGERPAVKGVCPDCGTTMFRFMPKKK